MEPIWFLVGLVLVAILITVIWNIFNVGELFAGMTRTQRLLVALLGLLLIIALLWYFLGGYFPFPRHP